MGRRPQLASVLVVAALLSPLAVLAVRVGVEDAPSPSGDVGLIEVRVRDVGTDRTPLLGSYSRFGFNQPGPALLYALAAPYRLVGGRYAGMEVGAVAANALALLAIVAVAHRRGGRVGLVGAAGVLAVFVAGLGPQWLADPWEPHVLVAPGAALLVLAFDVVAGRAWSLPLVAGAATLIAQAWATMLPFAVAMGLWAAVGLAVRAGRDGAFRRTLRWSLVATVAVLGLLWTPPIVEQLRNEPGNLRAMSSTLNEPGTKLGLADAWRAVAGELGHRATWLGFEQRLDGPSTRVDLDAAPIVPVGAVVLVAATIVAVVRRQWTLALLGATAMIGTAAAVVALSRLIGPVFLWIPQWLRLIGLGAALTVGAAVVRNLPPTVARRVLVPVAVAVLVVAGVVSVIDVVGDWREDDPLRDAVLALSAPGARAVPGSEPVLVRSRVDANLAFGGDDVAIEVLVLGLERQGVSTVVDVIDANRFGPERAHPERARRELRLVAAGSEFPAGFTSVAAVDPLGPAGRRARRRVLVEAGLPGDATDREFLQAVSGDRTLLRFADRLQAHPDLPALELLLGPSRV